MKLYKDRLHQRSYSSRQIHNSMPRYHNKDIKILVTYQLWKMFLSVEINSEVIETAAQNCSLKKELSKILKNLQEKTSAEVSFLKNNTKREKKGNSSTGVFPRIVLIFFKTFFWKLPIDGCFWRHYQE